MRARRRSSSSVLLFWGQEDRSRNKSPGFARRSSSGIPPYSAGDSANRFHIELHAPSRRPSRSAAARSPSFSGSKPRSALHRDRNALQRWSSQPARTPTESLNQTRRSRSGSEENSRLKSSASRRRPASACTGVVASSLSARSIDCRVSASPATSSPRPPSLDTRNASTVQSRPLFCVQQTPRYWSSTSGFRWSGQVSAAPSTCRLTPGR